MGKLLESLVVIIIVCNIANGNVLSSKCGGSFKGKKGSFSSPGYPNSNYPNNARCLWKIEAPKDTKKIIITFPVFNVEWYSDCSYDYVEVLDTKKQRIGKTLCGSTDKKVEVPGHIAYVKLYSDDMMAEKGFLANFEAVPLFKQSAKGDCDFDNGLCKDWSDDKNGDFLWTIGSGETPTQLTGPQNDHSGNGRYLFVESSAPHRPGDVARLVSTTLRTARCMSLYFFMYGFTGMGSLRVYVKDLSGKETLIWSRSGDYGRIWREATFPLKVDGVTPYQVVIEGVVGGSEYSDIAIDDITFSDDVCVEDVCGGLLSGSSGSFVSPDYPKKYPDNSRCTWTITGPANTKKIVIKFSEFELQTDAKCSKDYVKVLNNKEQQVGPNYCSYHPGGFGVKVDGRSAKVYFYSDHYVQRKGFNASFEVVTTDSKDDCDFDSAHCLWHNSKNDDFDWTVTSGETPSHFTGPYGDYFGLGKYTYIESSNRVQGDQADLLSSVMSGSKCMHFTYNLHGLHMGEINILQTYGYKSKVLLSKSGNHERGWSKASVNIPDVGLKYKIVIQGVVGSGFTSDAAVDEIMFTTGSCPSQPKSCGGYLTATSGVLQSPNFPNKYQNDITCDWVINPLPYYKQLEIEFKALNLEWSQGCSKDSLVIADGYKTQIGEKYCGALKDLQKTKVLIRGSKGHVTFTSDSNKPGNGFQLAYHVSQKRQTCGGELSGPSGTFSSPNYPKNYPMEEICEWELAGTNNKWLEITFKDFEIDDAVTCYYNYMLVYDGINRVEVGRYCGRYPPAAPIVIKSHVTNIRFATSQYGPARGFVALWRVIDRQI